MFKVGAEYRIYTGHGDALGSSVFEVLAFDSPLLKLKSVTGVTILNTSSPEFASAEKVLSNDEELARLSDFPGHLNPMKPPLG